MDADESDHEVVSCRIDAIARDLLITRKFLFFVTDAASLVSGALLVLIAFIVAAKALGSDLLGDDGDLFGLVIADLGRVALVATVLGAMAKILSLRYNVISAIFCMMISGFSAVFIAVYLVYNFEFGLALRSIIYISLVLAGLALCVAILFSSLRLSGNFLASGPLLRSTINLRGRLANIAAVRSAAMLAAGVGYASLAIVAALAQMPLTVVRTVLLATERDGGEGLSSYFELVALRLWAKAGRCLSPDARKLVDDPLVRPAVYLRSFGEDDTYVHVRSYLPGSIRSVDRVEEAIAPEIAAIAPFVAIGRPGEEAPRLGAARTYFSDDEWKLAIETWIRRASIIVVLVGTTSYLRWEIDAIRRCGRLDSTLFLFPPDTVADRMVRWRFFVEALGIDAPVKEADVPALADAIGVLVGPRVLLVFAGNFERLTFTRFSDRSHAEAEIVRADVSQYKAVILATLAHLAAA